MKLMNRPLRLVGLWLLDRSYYRFFASRRGLTFAIPWFPFHILHHLCNGLSFAVGTMLYLGQRWMGVALPGALPLTPWHATGAGPHDRDQRQAFVRS